MKKIILAASLVAIALTSCKNGETHDHAEKVKSPIDSLMDIVMKGHDEGMGKMGQLDKTAQVLNHRLDSLKKTKSPNPQLVAAWGKATKDMALADSSMNKWMDAFDMDMPNMDDAAKKKYLQSNALQVNAIADSLKNALHRAQALLEK